LEVTSITFAKWVFRLAGIYGLLALLPMYALERQIGMDTPPAITHPEYFYGFIGVAVAWQLAFIVMGQQPARFRPLMLTAVVEKFSFAGAVLALYLQGRLSGPTLGFASIDFLLGVLFLASFALTREKHS
jgi:hypothetical protein